MVGLAALGAACGSDGGGDGGAASGGSVDSGPVDTGSVDDWCAILPLATEGDAIFESIATATPEELEAGMDRIGEIVPQLVAAAPSEVAADVEYLAQYTTDLRSAFEASDYSLFDTDVSFIDQVRNDQVQVNLDEYSVLACGETFGDDDRGTAGGTVDSVEDGAFDPSGGTIRDQFVGLFTQLGFTAAEAECLADNVDPSDQGVLDGDVEAILALLADCDIPPSRLEELDG